MADIGKWMSKIIGPKKEGGKDAKTLRGIPIKYVYAVLGTIFSILVGLLVTHGDDSTHNPTAIIDAANSLGAELYQRKNVSLDEIETIAGSRIARSNVNSKKYGKGDYVENDGLSDTKKRDAKPSSELDGPMNIFSDPRYAVSGQYESSSGKGALSFNIPAGTIIRAYLENEVTTSQSDVPVVGIIYYTSSDGGSKYLPEGARMIGKIRDVIGNHVSVEFREGFMPDGSRFRISGIAMSEESGSRFQGIAGIMDSRVGRRGGSLIASSALNATRTLTHLTGNSWGSVFAGEMADQSMDNIDDTLNRSLDTYNGPEVILPVNTRFQIVVH